MTDDTNLPATTGPNRVPSPLERLADIPEEEISLSEQKSARTRRAYRLDVQHFMRSLGITMPPELKHNVKLWEERRRMDPDAIDRVVRKYAAARGLDRAYSAHSVRATFIAPALENGAQLEDLQKAAEHHDPGTTKLCDPRGYNPEKAASFFATY